MTTKADSTTDVGRLTLFNPERLQFKSWEEQDIRCLWPLFRTPRSVKRFINVYRLLRASLDTDAEVAKFEGTDKQPGDYQQVLLLLAVTTAFPNEASHFFSLLKKAIESDPEVTWSGAVEIIKGYTSHATLGAADVAPSTTPTTEAIEAAAGIGQNWLFMLDQLRILTDAAFPKRLDEAIVVEWVPRVARFSFSITVPSSDWRAHSKGLRAPNLAPLTTAEAIPSLFGR